MRTVHHRLKVRKSELNHGVLQRLLKEGIFDSERPSDGGYDWISVPKDYQIPVAEVLRSMDTKENQIRRRMFSMLPEISLTGCAAADLIDAAPGFDMNDRKAYQSLYGRQHAKRGAVRGNTRRRASTISAGWLPIWSSAWRGRRSESESDFPR